MLGLKLNHVSKRGHRPFPTSCSLLSLDRKLDTRVMALICLDAHVHIVDICLWKVNLWSIKMPSSLTHSLGAKSWPWTFIIPWSFCRIDVIRYTFYITFAYHLEIKWKLRRFCNFPNQFNAFVFIIRFHHWCQAFVIIDWHYDDVTMGTIASLITSLTIVYATVYTDVDQRKHQSSASLAFVWRIHRRPVNSPHKWPVTRKMFPFDDVIMIFHFLFQRPHCWNIH